MEAKIQREIRFLKAYAVVLTALLAASVIHSVASADQKARFDEIDVERINVVEKDGKLKMVISNKERAPDAIINGKSYPRQGGNSAGMIFFNDRGDECGGLVFSGRGEAASGSAGGALLFDQLTQDQTVGIMYNESSGRRVAGFNVWDRPDTPVWKVLESYDVIRVMKDGLEKTEAMRKFRESGQAGARRVFVGKDQDKAAAVVLSDPSGRPRIRMSVDAGGVARLEFLDEMGKVSFSLPEASKSR